MEHIETAHSEHKHYKDPPLFSKHFHLPRVLLFLYVAIIAGMIFGTIGYLIGLSQGLTKNLDIQDSAPVINVMSTAPVSQTPLSQPFQTTIRNSGSTNFLGWSLTISGDGSGNLAAGQIIRQYPAGTFNATSLKQFLGSLPNVSVVKPFTGCAKSVSFGSSTFITYNGYTSGDITCIPTSSPYANLALLISNISQMINSTVNLHRVP
jgi:hypothetical protein